MTNEVQTASRAVDSVQLKKLFGPEPVLSTESVEAYNAIVTLCLDSVRPRDFMEQLLTKDVVDASWEIRRYMWHKCLGIERKCRARIEYQEKSATEEAERREQRLARQQETAKNLKTEQERVYELQYNIDESVDDVDKILLRKPEELDHARSLEEGIEFHEKLDRLLNASVARRNNALEQLERYRNGLGQQLRGVSQEIIDAECSEAETHAGQEMIVPSIEGTGQ
jgi:hypothetical protein